MKPRNVERSEKMDATKKQFEAVTSVLREMGVPANVQGYYQIREAVLLVLNKPGLINNLGGQLWPMVAERTDSTVSRIDRNTRHAIEMTWERGNKKGIQRVFGYKPDMFNKPALGLFIATLAEYIRVYCGKEGVSV